MSKSVQRVGDPNTGGGIIVGAGHSNVRINGRPAAKPQAKVTTHMGCNSKTPQHCKAFTLAQPGSRTVRANGQPLILTGDRDTCVTHTRVAGSPNVKAV